MEQDNEEGKMVYPDFPLSQKFSTFGASAIVLAGIPAILHAPLPAEIGGLGVAFAIACNSPKIYAQLRGDLPAPVVEVIDHMIKGKQERAATGKWSTWDRLLGRHTYVGKPSPPEESPTPALPGNEAKVVGVSSREDLDGISPLSPSREIPLTTQSGVMIQPAADNLPAPVSERKMVFSSLLSRFTPSMERIYLATTMDGIDVYCTIEDLCHVATAGNTGGGKTSILRLLMAQLCKSGAQVLLLNPHYTHYDVKHNEDWTPYEPYLLYDPMKCKEYAVIEHYLKYTAEVLLPKRLDRFSRSLPTGKPYFLFLDELPAIIRHIEKAPEYLRPILEEGRKVGIFLVSAAHDFLIGTIAPKSRGGSIRECYQTAYYAGGDITTAKALLDLKKGYVLDEDQLGKGVVMLRCAAVSTVKKAALCRVPYLDNVALYILLGPSTYQPGSYGDEEADDMEMVAPSQQEIPALSPMYEAIINMRVARYQDEEIRKLVGMREKEYQHAIDYLTQHALIPRSPDARAFERESTVSSVEMGNVVNSVEPLEKPVNGSWNGVESSLIPGNVPPTFTQADEVKVILAFHEMTMNGEKPTRTALRDYLGWNSKQYTALLKPICDKHGILMEGA